MTKMPQHFVTLRGDPPELGCSTSCDLTNASWLGVSEATRLDKSVRGDENTIKELLGDPLDAFQQRRQLVSGECTSGAAGGQNLEKSCVEIVVSVGNMRLIKTEDRYRELGFDRILEYVSCT